MTTHRPIAYAILLAALSTASIAMAEPKGLVGIYHRPAASSVRPPAPVHTAQCDCAMMKADATMCMSAMGHPSDGASKPASAG